MALAGPVPEHEALLHELELVRKRSLGALRRLDLPALRQAAAAAGLTTTETQPEPAAVEKLIRMAVDRFGGGAYQEAAQYTFGLVGGTKFEIAPERRRRAAKSCDVSTETFRKTHEKVILEQTAEAILALVYDAALPAGQVVGSDAAQRLISVPNPHDDVPEVPMTSLERDKAHRAQSQTETIERAPARTASRKPVGRRGRVVGGLVAAALVLEMAAGAVVLTGDDVREPTWDGLTAAELERRYDGKLPGGQDGTESHCADGDAPPSLFLGNATTPPVMGPEGNQVATIQLRKSQICPTAVWARVLWKGDELETWQIPPGWTLHVVMHRPDTKSSFDETEPSTSSPIPYALSSMIASARGCVYAEAYFTNGDARTASVPTSCVQA